VSEPIGGIACGPDGCKAISRDVAEALWEAAMAQKAKRAADMPDERTALRVLTDAHIRLKELGWREATYAPRNVPLELIECGSSGIHTGYRDEHGFWILDDDTWPSKPVLYREQTTQPTPHLLTGE
jgi:hypothetical protein